MPATATEPLAAMHSAIREQRRSRIRGRLEKKIVGGGGVHRYVYGAESVASRPPRCAVGPRAIYAASASNVTVSTFSGPHRPGGRVPARRARRPVPLRHDDAEACGDLGTQAA